MDDNITKKELTTILTQDSYYRKLQKWPLLILNDIVKLNRKVDDIFSIDGYIVDTRRTLSTFERFNKSLSEAHPYVNELSMRFRGHLVSCGGSITKILNGMYSSGDIDLFFYDLNTDEANKMRISAIEFIINSWLENTKDDPNELKYYINRNEYVTTLYVTVSNGYDDIKTHDIFKYQFIHRIYPDMSSIIGGFDLSICMVAYDGNKIYATPLGAWSIKNSSIIIDTKRRSTSFEYRLQKYERCGFRLLFPGLPISIMTQIVDKEKRNYDDMMNNIYEIINNHGYSINRQGINIDNLIARSEGRLQLSEGILPYFKLCHYYQHSNNNLSLKLSTKSYNRDKIEERFVEKISDYDSPYTHPMCLSKINSQQLRLDKLNLVCSIIEISNNNKSNLHNLLMDDVNNPNIMFDDNIIKCYKDRTERIRELTVLVDYQNINNNFHQLSKCFGKLTPEVVKIQHTDEYYKYCNIIIDKMKINAEICKENLIGIKWISQSPGRQWTASINPIIADPRQWYGKHYDPVLTGIPTEVETTMRLMRLPKTESVWTIINDDIFNVICICVLNKYANDAWNYVE